MYVSTLNPITTTAIVNQRPALERGRGSPPPVVLTVVMVM